MNWPRHCNIIMETSVCAWNRKRILSGSYVIKMKKLLLPVLVLTLALSLTSCSRKNNPSLQNQNEFAYFACDGSIGQFDAYLIRSKTNPGLIQLSVIPVTLTNPGDIVSINVANSQLAYKEMVNQVVLFTDKEINAGFLTEQELQTYDRLAVTPFQPGVSFLEVQADRDAVCNVPLLGTTAVPTQSF